MELRQRTASKGRDQRTASQGRDGASAQANPEQMLVQMKEFKQFQQFQQQAGLNAMGAPLVPAAPQAADAVPYPIVATVCNIFTVLQMVASILVLCIFGIGQTVATEHIDPTEIRYFDNAKVMLLPAFLLELCHIISARKSGEITVSLHGYNMSTLVIGEYCIKMACYFSMASFHGGIVHWNNRAFGPPRPCYTVRYIEWGFAVPLLLALNNHPFLGNRDPWTFFRRLVPNLLVTFSYIFASWVAQVTPDAASGWSLVFVSFLAYLASIADQVVIAAEYSKDASFAAFKVGCTVFKEIVFCIYGVVYLLGCANIVSSRQEQAFYTYSDVLLKVVQASLLLMVRNWEDLTLIQQSLSKRVENCHQDMSRLVHKASAPVVSMDTDGRIKAWNERLAELSGIVEESAVGKLLMEFAESSCHEAFMDALKMCNTKGQSSKAVEITLQKPKRSQGSSAADDFYCRLVMNFIAQTSPDSSASIIAIGQDVTELVGLKVMQERNTRFMSMVSHELRSPLHGIIGLSSAMIGSARPHDKKQLTMVQGCAKRLLDLVTNIMDMSSLSTAAAKAAEQTEVDAPTAPVNLLDIMEEVCEMTRMALDKAGKPLVSRSLKLKNEMKYGTLPLISGDAYKCTQLFYNLVTNACKFTRNGSVSVSARHVPDEQMVEVDVSDTGVGISKDALERIFIPFEQENGADSRSFQGIGLGLSVAQGIARLHRGRISVKSVLGEGSTFTVHLPCRGGDAVGSRWVELDRENQAAARADDDEDDGKPLLLSVDDDEVNQQVLESALGESYRIERAMDGMEALAYLKMSKRQPRAVLLDIMMPGLTGFEVVREIRGKLKRSHVDLPVLMLSARAPADLTAQESMEAGGTDFLSKPFCPELLKMKLKLFLSYRDEASHSRRAMMATSSGDLPRIAASMQSSMDQLPRMNLSSMDLKGLDHGDAAAITDNATIAQLQSELAIAEEKASAAQSRAVRAEKKVAVHESQLLNVAEAKRAAAWSAPPTPAPRVVQLAPSLPGFSNAAVSATSSSDAASSILAKRNNTEIVFLKNEVATREKELTRVHELLAAAQSEAFQFKHKSEVLDRQLEHAKHLITLTDESFASMPKLKR